MAATERVCLRSFSALIEGVKKTRGQRTKTSYR
jgi:hypothetical protein